MNKENRIKAEQAKNARLEALKEKALAEEAERQAKAEARKAEILAGKFIGVRHTVCHIGLYNSI